jgi:murein DD-endopeptidase / murein LD-carboxypeptidase
MPAGDVIARARACIGARFRVQGRDPTTGLDCVGLAAAAFGREAAGDYTLRGGDAGALAKRIAMAGLRDVSGDVRAGDLLMVEAGPRQLHLIVLTESGFVHADARLRRVVETPGRPVWPVLCAWRACEDED